MISRNLEKMKNLCPPSVQSESLKGINSMALNHKGGLNLTHGLNPFFDITHGFKLAQNKQDTVRGPK